MAQRTQFLPPERRNTNLVDLQRGSDYSGQGFRALPVDRCGVKDALESGNVWERIDRLSGMCRTEHCVGERITYAFVL
ncbi:MAG: hypothetical protein IPM11_14135 [Micropruina sp.]|nr:hypothetical protein [Micropruina sp.]